MAKTEQATFAGFAHDLSKLEPMSIEQSHLVHPQQAL